MRSASGGPCCHCGTIQTPCWRKGPSDKPVLCNACGSRWLVKGSLVGYFPGARRSSATTREAATVPAPSVTIARGPRKAVQVTAGPKRKFRDEESYDDKTQRIYDDFDALEELRHSLFYRGAAAPFLGRSPAAAAVTASDSSTEVHHDDDLFRKDAHHLYASSDECQEPEPAAPGSADLRGMAATTATGVSGHRDVSFARRPRKQLRPVACSC